MENAESRQKNASTQISHVKSTLASLEEGGCLFFLQRHELHAGKLHGSRGKAQLLCLSHLLLNFSRSSSAVLTQSKALDSLDITCKVKEYPRGPHVPGIPGLMTWQNLEAHSISQGWDSAQPYSCIAASAWREAEQPRSEDHWGKVIVPLS